MIAINSAFERIGEENAFAVLARAAELQRQGRDIINLGIGQPDFKTPPHIVEAAVKALRDGEHGYTDATGIAPLREAVAEDLHRRLKVEVSPDLVLIVPGGKVTMFMAILMFGERGADIVYPDPGFPIYRSMIEFTGARPIPAPMRETNGFAFSAEETLALMTPQTRLVILNSPANPTGGVTPREEIDKLVAGLSQWPNAAILSDEIYGQLTYDGLAHRSLIAYPEIRDRLILLDGWSKTYAMTGWRLGYSVWPKPWREMARKLAVNSYSCVNSAAQFAGIAALKGPQDSVAAMRAEFDRRRKAVTAGLNRLPGVRAVTPKGAFYAFPNVARTRGGRRNPSPPRCCRKRAWRRSAGLISAFMAKATCACHTLTRWKISNARSSACRTFSAVPRARRRTGDALLHKLFRVPDVIMRPLVLAACAIAFCSLAEAQDAHPSQTVCDATKIGARELADCLRTNADRADRELAAAVDAAIKSIDARQGLLSSQKARWRRSLGDAQAQWVAWRDSECQDVAPFESGMDAKGGDPRLRCIIDYDAERVASLKARYP